MSDKKLHHDDLCSDEEVRKAKEKTMEHMKWGPILNMCSRALAMVGAPIFSFGLMAMFGFANIQNSVSESTILAATIVGGGMSLVGLGIDYISSRSYQSVGFDRAEVEAKTYAKNFVKELKANDVLISVDQKHEHEPHCRKDGKSWAQVVAGAQPETQRVM